MTRLEIELLGELNNEQMHQLIVSQSKRIDNFIDAYAELKDENRMLEDASDLMLEEITEIYELTEQPEGEFTCDVCTSVHNIVKDRF